HAGAGKTDQRTRLGYLYIAKHRVRGRDAPSCGVGEHDNVGLAYLAQHLHADRRTRQLHERKNAFLHACTTRGGEHDEWRLPPHGGFETGDHGLAGSHAERTAHEVEILNGDRDHLTFEPTDAELHGVLQSGLGTGVFQTIGVTALVAKLERISCYLCQGNIFEFPAVEDGLQAQRRTDAHMIV